jgi:hypothetical protein
MATSTGPRIVSPSPLTSSHRQLSVLMLQSRNQTCPPRHLGPTAAKVTTLDTHHPKEYISANVPAPIATSRTRRPRANARRHQVLPPIPQARRKAAQRTFHLRLQRRRLAPRRCSPSPYRPGSRHATPLGLPCHHALVADLQIGRNQPDATRENPCPSAHHTLSHPRDSDPRPSGSSLFIARPTVL